MNKIILVLCAIVAVANGLPQDSELKRLNDYLQHNNKDDNMKYLKDYFNKAYDKSIEPLISKVLPVIKSIYPLTEGFKEKIRNITEDLSEKLAEVNLVDNKCADNYRSSLPNINETKLAMGRCVNQYIYAIPPHVVNYMDKVFTPYEKGFSVHMRQCKKIQDQPEEYLSCVYFHQKAFNIFMAEFIKEISAAAEKMQSEYNALENDKTALNCIQSIENEVYDKVLSARQAYQNCNSDLNTGSPH